MPLKIHKRPGSPNWQISGTVAGQLVRKSARTSNRDIAERTKAELEAKLQRESLYGPAAEATFADACVRYLSERERSKFDRKRLAAILRKIGRMRLAQITPGKIKALACELHPGLKPQSLNREVIIPARAVINHAHFHGLCGPIKIDGFRAEGEKQQQAVDWEWIDRFREHAPPHLGALALLMFTTAARPKEALSLTPGDLDLDKNIGLVGRTKQGWGRILYLSGEMAAILRELPPVTSRHGEVKVFPWTDSRGLFVPYRKVCKAAGIPFRTPYEAGRHSMTTEMVVRQGIDVVRVARLGNFSPEVLLRRYAHAEGLDNLAEEVFGTKSAQKRRKKLKLIAKS